MWKKTLFFVWCVFAPEVLATDLQSLLPNGEITAETPSLESAYPGQMYIQRTPWPDGEVVEYEVRIYADEKTGPPPISAFTEVALVVSNEKGVRLVSTQVVLSGVSHLPPNKNEFRSFSFSIHKDLEKTTVINIGRYTGIRVLFTRYRLPLKSIDHPKAH